MALAKQNGSGFFTIEDLEAGKAQRTIVITAGEKNFKLRHLTSDEFMELVAQEQQDKEARDEAAASGDVPAELLQRNTLRRAKVFCNLCIEPALDESRVELVLSKVSASAINEAVAKLIRTYNQEAAEAGKG